MENPAQVGDPCFVVDNSASGIDNCAFGAMCVHLDENNEGRCVPLCTGDPVSPECPFDMSCELYSDGVLIPCIAVCDALVQDCEPGFVCIPNTIGDGFVCHLDGSGADGQAHDPCDHANGCDPGLFCQNSTAAVECDQGALGCCEPFCDLQGPNTCPGQGQLCNPVFEEGTMPGFEATGYCAVPG